MTNVRCDIVPIFPSPRALAIYSIGARTYTIYNTGVYYGTHEVLSFGSKIVDSVLCGEAIALFLSDSRLIVLSPGTLADEQLWGAQAEIAEEITGIAHFHEMLPTGTQMISADYSGTLICVNLGFSTVAVFEYSAAANRLRNIKSSIIEHDFSQFQIVSVGLMPYLWTVEHQAQAGYVVGLHEIASLAFKHTEGRTLCRLPLNIPANVFSPGKVELFPAGERDGGLLVFGDKRLFYITLSSAIAGDTHPTTYPEIDWAGSLFYSQTSSSTREFYVTDADGSVLKLGIQASQRRLLVHPDSVASLPEEVLAGLDGWLLSLTLNTELLCVRRGGTRISQCELDTRKWPWRTLILSGSHLTALASTTTVDYTDKAVLNNLSFVLTMVEVPRLHTLFISTANGTGWLAAKQTNFDWLKPRTVLQIAAIENSLMVVFTDSVELRSVLAPHNILETWKPRESDVILDASIGRSFCLLRLADRVLAISTSMVVNEVFSGLATTFVRCDNGASYIGVSAGSDSERYSISQKLPRYKKHMKSVTGAQSIQGATIHLSDDLSEPAQLQFHQYLPTDHIKLAGGTEVILHAADGKVTIHAGKRAPAVYDVFSSVHVAGRVGSRRQAAILFGRGGLWAVTDEGCRLLRDRKSRKLGGMIERACTLQDGTIALAIKGELRFVCSPLSYGNQLPTQLQSASNLGKNTRMLLVPSKRMIIVHGGSACTFLDSVTFQTLLVSGLRAQCCDEVCLWRFELQGEPYEQLVFSNGRAAIESYAIERNNLDVTLTCKLRFLVSRESEMVLKKPEVLHCHDQYIYLGRHDYILKTSPMENQRFGPIYLDSTIRCISQAGSHLIVSTEKSLNVLDTEKFRILASAQVAKSVTSGHVAGFVTLDGRPMLHILCAREKESFVLFVFDGESVLQDITPQVERGPERDRHVRSFSRFSNRKTENGFRVLAIMSDYSIKQIDVQKLINAFGNG